MAEHIVELLTKSGMIGTGYIQVSDMKDSYIYAMLVSIIIFFNIVL
jgi:hypothetical protein